MRALLEKLLDLPELAEIAASLAAGKTPQGVSGLAPVHRAQAAAALAHRLGRPLAVICAGETEAGRMAGDLETLTGQKPVTLFGRELWVRPGATASHQWEHRRLAALYDLGTRERPVVVATAEGLLQKTCGPAALREAAFSLAVGTRMDLGTLPERLVALGYSRTEQVEGPGQFALRGGILDIFSPGMDRPVRCDFFDDEVDGLGAFDSTTQRRTENVAGALVLPASERWAGAPLVSAFDALPPDTLLCLTEGAQVAERVKNVLWQAREDTETLLEAGEKGADLTALLLSQSQWLEELGKRSLCMMEALPTSRWTLSPRGLTALSVKQLSAYGGSLDTATGDLQHYLSTGSAVLLLCGSRPRGRNLQRLLEDRGIPVTLDFEGGEMPRPGEARITVGSLSAGAEYPALKLAVLTEGQLTAPLPRKSPRPEIGRASCRERV